VGVTKDPLRAFALDATITEPMLWSRVRLNALRPSSSQGQMGSLIGQSRVGLELLKSGSFASVSQTLLIRELREVTWQKRENNPMRSNLAALMNT
jgi:hypothetical protein